MCRILPEKKRLLAAETFFRSFVVSENIKHSVISFDTPVNISEVKILSPSQHISTDKGGFMIGTTKPSRFPLQLFCNSINRNTEEFVKLNTIMYNEDNPSTFNIENCLWSDKLIVRGRFMSLTIIVYGTPKDPFVEYVQSLDETTNLPSFDLPEGGMPNILTLSDEFILDPALIIELSNLELDPNYY